MKKEPEWNFRHNNDGLDFWIQCKRDARRGGPLYEFINIGWADARTEYNIGNILNWEVA